MKNLILLTLILAGLNTFAENSTQNNVDFSCPDNYVRVPALEGYTTNDFCVMKYEAKNDGSGNAISQASGTPYVNINRDDSIDKCTSLGEGYDLITNDEWQTVARNIELVPDNWGTGVIGVKQGLSRGHSGYHPPQALEACIRTGTRGQVCSDINMTWYSQRRTHTLSNGEVIWDIAGNVWEWVKTNSDSGDYFGYKYGGFPIALITNTEEEDSKKSLSGSTRDRFGPSRNYLTVPEALHILIHLAFDEEYATQRVHFRGFGFGYLNSDRAGIYRGGSWSDVSDAAGVFAVSLDTPLYTSQKLGFRCVFHP